MRAGKGGGCAISGQSSEGATIGLIGGLAPRAGIYYYEQILQRHAALGRPACIMLNHADVDRVLACVSTGDRAGLGDYLGALANALFDGGASLVAITAVAPHLAIDAIARVARGKLINVLDCVTAGLAATGVKRVAIFGNRAVMATRLFATLPRDRVVELQETEIDLVHRLYTGIALGGKRGTPDEMALLGTLAHELIDHRGAQAILLAGTDLSSFYADTKPDYPFHDLAQLHLEAIMQAALNTSPH